MGRILLIAVFSFLCACDKMLVGGDITNSPENNFEVFWQEYDRNFANFSARNINWEEQYQIYRPKVNSKTTELELWEVLTDMMSVLNDTHCYLISEKRFFSSAGEKFYRSAGLFNLNFVKNYLTNKGVSDDGVYHYGKLSETIGYIHIAHVGNIDVEIFINILKSMGDMDGLVIDARNNSGGNPDNALEIASIFTTDSKPVYSRRYKNGTGDEDFSDFNYISIAPNSSYSFLKPVAFLINGNTVSAGDIFATIMAELGNVTLIGENTAGSFSASLQKELPNGWIFNIAFEQDFDVRGNNREGQGVPPDIIIETHVNDVLIGEDKVLEAAKNYIESSTVAE